MKKPSRQFAVDSGLCCIMQSRFMASRDKCGQRANPARKRLSFRIAKFNHATLFHEFAIFVSRQLG
jgi:hypothetical protein